ncbi:hypothetical protein CEXT_802191 [Caerostris extrusa]|uniref:Uncharacterized protein n=1 Tax=Caerostris extrusa TaxID=172846 RepID=A0AAV4NXR8_CAEEX|nr:hypothetical protein CEXT_802191 [Caerostris extrusa]
MLYSWFSSSIRTFLRISPIENGEFPQLFLLMLYELPDFLLNKNNSIWLKCTQQQNLLDNGVRAKTSFKPNTIRYANPVMELTMLCRGLTEEIIVSALSSLIKRLMRV